MGLSPEDLDQISQIIKQTVDAAVEDKLAFLLPEEDELPGEEEAVPAAETPEGETAVASEGAVGDQPAAEPPAAATPPEKSADEPMAAGEENPDDSDGDKMKKYMAAGDKDGAVKCLDEMSADQRDKLAQKYSKLPADNLERKFYMAAAEAAKPAGAVDETADAKLVAKYRRERDELLVKYQAVQAERDDLKGKVDGALKSERYHRQYSKLLAKRDEGFVIPDIEEELRDTAHLDDAGFDHHVEKVITTRYQRIPTRPLFREKPEHNNGDTPPGSERDARLPAGAAGEPASAKTVRKYSKKAREYAEEQINLGKSISFQEALEHVSKGMAETPEREAVVA